MNTSAPNTPFQSTNAPGPPYNPSESPSSPNTIVFILIGILSALVIMIACVALYIFKLSKRISDAKPHDEAQIRNRLLTDEVITRQIRTKLEKEMEAQLGDYSRKHEEMKKLQDVNVYEDKLKELMDEGYEKEVAMILIHCTSEYEKTLRTSIKDLSKNVEDRETEVSEKIERNANEALKRETEEQRTRAVLKSPTTMFELPGDETIPEYEGEYLPPSRTVRRDVDLSVIKHELELAEARRESITSDPPSEVPSQLSDKLEVTTTLKPARVTYIPPQSPQRDPTYNEVQGIGRYRTGHWSGNNNKQLPDHLKTYVSDLITPTDSEAKAARESKNQQTPKPDRNSNNSIGRDRAREHSNNKRGSVGSGTPTTERQILSLVPPMPPKPKKYHDGRILKSVII